MAEGLRPWLVPRPGAETEDEPSKGAIMKAAVGDQIVIESMHLDEPRRIGTIVALRHEDGSPPYVVRWEGQEHETLVFPGPDARIVARHPA
ncbi:hypothetical protein GCM10010106_40930 [Thermopolyspora flexuosa]|nr:hypothetical protein GCM10010106_40930 [Thermopolyspora flexuosa]